MPKQTIMLDLYKDGKKQAEVDIVNYTIEEIKLLLEIQEMMGRTWSYRHIRGNNY